MFRNTVSTPKKNDRSPFVKNFSLESIPEMQSAEEKVLEWSNKSLKEFHRKSLKSESDSEASTNEWFTKRTFSCLSNKNNLTKL